MTRNNQRDNNVMTDVKLAAISALATALVILLANASPGWGADEPMAESGPIIDDSSGLIAP
ncbi:MULTISPECIES: hypothetical protein [Blastomonas]|jgi:hypothetical protein|uniref:hypothetical protein n=1 Tax=Blastomonas TaxID=150203 RepID=UPI00083DA1D3|nr:MULTISPECIES: hypothetical protein [Blastomonas]AOG01738.1 hypothetical protein BSY18_2346 [Blastomonas sp. RAC04]MDM7927637.1 hypothetical protein [Blastomonas fulva]MDM7965264.1 hypothetical protein [Blastomonas fulva]